MDEMSDTKRYHQEWTDLVSDHLAGDLDEHARAGLEAHLAECAGCRAVYAELRDVVVSAAALTPLEPPRDLWPGIAAALISAEGSNSRAPGDTRSGDAVVIELPTARAANRGRGGPGVGGLLGTRAGLAAAAAGLVLLTATGTWWLAAPPAASLTTGGASDSAGSPVLAVDTGTPPEGLANELAVLEAALQVARSTLDPNTVLVLERNLAVIEQAIADSREALVLDPNNAFLSEHLERMYRRKLDYLQDAVRAAEWSG